MLTHDRLVELYRAHRRENVLSIYLDGEQHDPAERSAWRRVLDHGLTDARRSASTAEDAARFDAAAMLLQLELDAFDAFLPDRAWVGFATAEKVLYAQPVPVPMPNLVRWEPGLRVAPYVRALKQERLVVTALVDSRRARVFQYRDGQFTPAAELHADTIIGDLSDVGTAKRATTHSGMRGETGTDAAKRALDVGTDRMLKPLVETIVELAGSHGFVVLGGSIEAVSAAMQRLPRSLAKRVREHAAMHFDMSPADVKQITQTAASALTRDHQNHLLDQVLDAARAQGKACLGVDETLRALRDRRVETLLLSQRFLGEDPDRADHFVGAAFEQGAEVEQLSGEAADRLDAEADSIAASLRYRL